MSLKLHDFVSRVFIEVSSTREDILLQVNLSIRIPDIRITWPTNDAPSKPQRGGGGEVGGLDKSTMARYSAGRRTSSY